MLNQIRKDSNNWKGTMMAKKKKAKKKVAKKKATKKKKKWSNDLVTSLPVTWIRDFNFLLVKLIRWFNFSKISHSGQAMRKTEGFTKRKSSVFFISGISDVITTQRNYGSIVFYRKPFSCNSLSSLYTIIGCISFKGVFYNFLTEKGLWIIFNTKKAGFSPKTSP